MKAQREREWAEAKRRCRLSVEELRMAKELGMSPRSLMKNIPSPSQRWKMPVKAWVRDLHARKFGERRETQPPPARVAPPTPARAELDPLDDDDIPF